MKLIAILTTLVLGFASTNAQHHLPPSATSNANINDGGINSPTSSNIDIDSVATIIDKANDNTERKLHDMLTSVKDVIEEKYGLDLNDALGLGGNGRRLSKSHKSEGIDIIDKVFLLIVLLLVEFLGYTYVDYLSGLVYLVVDMIRLTGEEEEDIADEITAANHGHDGSSSNTAKSEGTDSSAKASKESKSVSCILLSFFLSLLILVIPKSHTLNHTYPIKVKVGWWFYLPSRSNHTWLCYKWQSLLYWCGLPL